MSVQVLERIKDPLVTLISRDQYETAYAVLAHFLVIAQRAPIIFASVRATQHWRWHCAAAAELGIANVIFTVLSPGFGAGLLQIYQSFYCRMNDPSYIKDLKLQLLSAVADDSNAFEIVTELTEYVTDIDEHLAREAVRAVGRIALQVSPLLLLPAACAPLQQY